MLTPKINLLAIFLEMFLVSWLILDSLPVTQSTSENKETRKPNRHLVLSSSEECARLCYVGEPPKTCYYKFTLESYTVLGRACETCTPNNTNQLQENCQCVLADGVEKPILTVNRMVPGPSIQLCKGDKVVIDVTNKIEGMETSIHWHGPHQRGSQYYDGVPFVTQCPIHEGNTFRYQWVAQNAGTHFWHSHDGLQKMDGIYGSLIIREPRNKEANDLYDDDLRTHVMVISDWMHELANARYPGRLFSKRGQIPESALINGKGQYTDRNSGITNDTPLEVFTVKPGRRYRFRMINSFSSTCAAEIIFEGHTMTLIATDGKEVRPVKVNMLNSFSGERYDFVINADQSPRAYWIQLRALGPCATDRVQQIAILHYEGTPPEPITTRPAYEPGLPRGVVFNPLDGMCDTPREDAVCISQLRHTDPIDREILKPQPDVKLFLSYRFSLYQPDVLFKPKTYNRYEVAVNGALASIVINNKSYVSPPSPPLSQINDILRSEFCHGDQVPANCGQETACSCTHRMDIPLNAMVEVILVDEGGVPNLFHPFHLHGYAFNVMGMGRSPDKNVTRITVDHVRDLDRRGLLKRDKETAPFKDTIPVPSNGYVIFRFRANNPGEWLFHCHFAYHIVIGMELIFHVGTVKDLPPVPRGFPQCGNFLPPITPAHERDDSIYDY